MKTLEIDQKITIHGLNYEVVTRRYLSGIGCQNYQIFDLLGIKDKYGFIRNIVGYEPDSGYFPEVKNLEDLTKVAEALINYGKSSSEDVEVYTNF